MSDDWQIRSMERSRVEAEAAVAVEQAKAARVTAEGEAKALEIRAKIDLLAAETRQKLALDESYHAGKARELELRATEATALVPIEEAKASADLAVLEANLQHEQAMLKLRVRGVLQICALAYGFGLAFAALRCGL